MFDNMTTSHTVNITINQDDENEEDQFFYLNLTLPNQSNRQKRSSPYETVLGSNEKVTIRSPEYTTEHSIVIVVGVVIAIVIVVVAFLMVGGAIHRYCIPKKPKYSNI